VWSWSPPKNSIKGREKIKLLRRFSTPLLKKNYSFLIKMSTGINKGINDYHLQSCIVRENLKMRSTGRKRGD
jgi:hypothetical protein